MVDLHKLREAGNIDEQYVAELDANIIVMGGNKDVIYGSRVKVTYDIVIDAGSWGIKDIRLIPRGQINLDVTLLDLDTDVEEDITVTADLEDSTIEWMEGGGYGVTGLSITIDDVGRVQNIEIEASYIKPN